MKHLVSTNIVGRLPNGMGPLVVALFLRAQGFDYAVVGLLAALYGLATAVGGPVLGRFVDLHGQTRVLLGSAAASTAGFLTLSVTSREQVAVAALSIVIAGLFTPPLEPCLRSLWPYVLDSPRAVSAAYALDAALQEVIFVAGPLLVVAFVSALGTSGAVVVTGVLAAIGTLGFLAAPPTRSWRAERRAADWLGPLRSSTLRYVLLAFVFVGGTIGMLNILAVAYAEARHSAALSGIILGANAFGALIGGLVYGARDWPGSAQSRLTWLMLGLALGYVPLAFTPSPALFLPLAVLSGICLAPALACVFAVIGDVVPAGTTTEAFAWLVTIFVMGNAIGTSLAGTALEHLSLEAAFTAPALSACCGFLVLTSARLMRARAERVSANR
ncbi:MFS transporter [Saccharopolyspora halophila]|uniref:MFS transporter n=1 Tax=Saccharopolyspora halophila TaxID=405551 RepID=UPI0031E0AD37